MAAVRRGFLDAVVDGWLLEELLPGRRVNSFASASALAATRLHSQCHCRRRRLTDAGPAPPVQCSPSLRVDCLCTPGHSAQHAALSTQPARATERCLTLALAMLDAGCRGRAIDSAAQSIGQPFGNPCIAQGRRRFDETRSQNLGFGALPGRVVPAWAWPA